MIRNLAFISTIVMFISCGQSVVFEEYKSFESQSWNADSAVFFNCFISDTTSKK